MCCVVLQIPRSRHAWLVADKSLASSKHPRPTRSTRQISSWHANEILARMSRGCYEETAAVKFRLNNTDNARQRRAIALDSGLLILRYENVMASTNRKYIYISQRRQKRTEPWPQATCIGLQKFGVKISRVIFKLCERTDKQTNRLTYSSQYLATIPGREVIIEVWRCD